jgi:anaerobic magnesium-protoporphyrin IX monomethyl ester cyclase
MNVVFIDPPFKRFTGFSNPYFPVGLAYLSAVCKKNGHSAVVYEVDAQEKTKTIDMDFSHEHQKLELYKQAVNDVTNPIWEEIVQTVKALKPDVIGITMMTTKIASAIRTANVLKENFSNIPIIVGGPHATLLPEQCFKVESIDYVLRGESENTILPLLSFIAGDLDIKRSIIFLIKTYLEKLCIMKTEKLIETLDEIPFPDRESLLYLPNYSSEDLGIIMATRGCPYGCTYCAHMFGRRVRKRSVENVLEEMFLLKKKYGAIQISFKDDTFTVDKNGFQSYVRS